MKLVTDALAALDAKLDGVPAAIAEFNKAASFVRKWKRIIVAAVVLSSASSGGTAALVNMFQAAAHSVGIEFNVAGTMKPTAPTTSITIDSHAPEDSP